MKYDDLIAETRQIGGVTQELAEALRDAAADVERLEREKARALDIAQEANGDCRKLAALLAESRAVIEQVREIANKAEHGCLRWADPLPVPEWVGRVREALATSPAEALNVHDAEVAAKALEEAAMVGAEYQINPYTSHDYQEGASHADIYWQLALERAAAAIRAGAETTESEA